MARVLIVDDDRDVLEVARRAFERQGHAAVVCETLAAGLEAARAGGFDAVLMDLELPDGSGLTAVRPIAEAAGAPVLLMTGHFDPDLERDALLLGARALLPKPLDLVGLAARFAEYLA